MTTDRFRLDGRTVLVTGGAGFLGRRWVAALLDAGATVISVDRMAPTVDDPSGRLVYEQVDITDPHAVSDLADRLSSANRQVDVLVNNAALDAPVSASGLDLGRALRDLLR